MAMAIVSDDTLPPPPRLMSCVQLLCTAPRRIQSQRGRAPPLRVFIIWLGGRGPLSISLVPPAPLPNLTYLSRPLLSARHTRPAKDSLCAPLPSPSLPHAHSFPPASPRRRRAMAGVRSLVLLLLVLAFAALSASASSIAGGDHLQLGLLNGRGECRGTVAECGGEDAEGELGSASAEAHRRVLQNRGYISYGALRRGTVPCNRRGASYYNCRPGAQANPYHRGCSRITRCRG